MEMYTECKNAYVESVKILNEYFIFYTLYADPTILYLLNILCVNLWA